MRRTVWTYCNVVFYMQLKYLTAVGSFDPSQYLPSRLLV